MGHAFAGKNYPPSQVGVQVASRVESATKFCEKAPADGSPKYLAVDWMLFQLGRANDFALIGARAEALGEGGVETSWCAKTSGIF